MKRKLTPVTFREMEIPRELTADMSASVVFALFQKVNQENGYDYVIKQYNAVEKRWIDYAVGCSPRISPDGRRLLYIQPDGIMKYKEINTGKEIEIGAFCRPRNCIWSQDGLRLAFTASVMEEHDPDDLPPLKEGIWIDRTRFKTDGEGIFDGTYRHVFVYDIRSRMVTDLSGNCKRDAFSPTFLGDKVVYAAVPENSDNSDDFYLYIHSVGTGKVCSVRGIGGPILKIAGNNDKQQIVILGHDNVFWEATNFNIYVYDIRKDMWRCITKDTDKSFIGCIDNDMGFSNAQPLFLTGDNMVYAVATEEYAVHLYEIDCAAGSICQKTFGDEVIFALEYTGDGFYAVRSRESMAVEVVKYCQDKEEILFSSPLNDENYLLGKGMDFDYEDENHISRKGRCFLPEGTVKGMILNIHGGPHYSFGYDFSYDIQLLLGYGLGTVICNPSGSQGSGQQIAKASYHDWGGRDYRELLAMVNAAQEKFGLRDIPWALMGGSYGGFMVNWIVGHNQDFCCAISERSTCNRYSQSGTSDCAFRYGMYEFDGYAWENPAHYMEHSPISYVKNVETPLLLLHGELDMNCPISQSEEWYSALRLEQKEAYFCLLPGEFHDFKGKGKPEIREERYRLLIWWFTRYCDGATHSQ